jgi:hypothetical protein
LFRTSGKLAGDASLESGDCRLAACAKFLGQHEAQKGIQTEIEEWAI